MDLFSGTLLIVLLLLGLAGVISVLWICFESPYSTERCPDEYQLVSVDDRDNESVMTFQLPLQQQSTCIRKRPFMLTRSFAKKMSIMLRHTSELLEQIGVNYWLTGPSLAGALYHKGFIPWCDEIHIAVLYQDLRKLVNARDMFESHELALVQRSDRSGYEIRPLCTGYAPIIDVEIFQCFDTDAWVTFSPSQANGYQHILAPCTPLTELGDGRSANISDFKDYTLQVKDVFPLKKVPFMNMELPVPNNTEKLITVIYNQAKLNTFTLVKKSQHLNNRYTQAFKACFT